MMKRTKELVFILLSAICLMGCENNRTTRGEELDSIATADSVCEIPEYRAVLYDEDDRRIILATSDGWGEFLCYVQNGNGSLKKVDVGAESLDGAAIYQYRYGDNIFIVGDIQANSNGWTINYPIHRLNVKTLQLDYLESAAAIHFDKDGFKIAKCRLTNEDAMCTADEIWVIHNCYYNSEGEKIKEDSKEYYYDHMVDEYGEEMVNAERVSFK